jgi:hypothetical protein
MDDAEELSGGNVTRVVRIGDTVHRGTGPWSAAVHGLLGHLERKGFDGAPRFLGLDDEQREVLSFFPGEVVRYPFPGYVWLDAVLLRVGELMRGLHDATIGYEPPPSNAWQLTYPDHRKHEIICHNDIAPYNVVFVDKRPTAFIDFDVAGPGPRAWDLAHAAYRFVPFSYTADLEQIDANLTQPAHQARRLRLLCSAYGGVDPVSVLHMVESRLETLCATLEQQAEAGNQAYQRLVQDGHLAHYRTEISDWWRHCPDVESHLMESAAGS